MRGDGDLRIRQAIVVGADAHVVGPDETDAVLDEVHEALHVRVLAVDELGVAGHTVNASGPGESADLVVGQPP